MENDEKRVDGELHEDRISALPDCLIDVILNLLSDELDFVVRTSVLSRRWRYCWTRVRNMCFNLKLISKYVDRRELNVASFVDLVLSRHQGPIDKFRLYGHCNCLFFESFDVCRWMQLLSEKKIQEITVRDQAYICELSSPLLIFQCSTLTHLSLYYSCQFGNSSDFGSLSVTNLVHLHLDCVRISGSLLANVISHSPLLRDLKFNHVGIKGKYSSVAIDAPKLQNLALVHGSGRYDLREYPSLISACISVNVKVDPLIGKQGTCALDSFVRTMPRVENLTLSVYYSRLTTGDTPTKLPITLQNLKNLEVEMFDAFSLDELSCAFCLIRSSPKLQSLKFQVVFGFGKTKDEVEAAFGFIKAQAEAGSLIGLSKLTFDSLLGHEYEVKFISILLKCCPMLKTVEITSNEYIERDSEALLINELEKLWRPESATMIYKSQRKEDGHC